ncbi:hypothetical protein Back11_05240 [Paenibacillus baekrokdamisoli]|uniref:Uncharacterized protein n=1 Tax=Paenibacillus baekrokdamisoli TaxID=1712516 RepID=A0A3G9J831_9BACL|nr:hypothetical protein [Paenibacillus baekrokdamisoli]MBB3067634.1 hypothetical protein [Paenibacillus baekrokdamisoli]BBH19179.1 hypothetical protein Back11_05240 [Paenibacillus baekrokdamisoli]
MKVIEAYVRRAVDRDGIHCCEVEVHTDQQESPELLAFFGTSLDNDYDLVAIVRNDASTEVDWYDNSMHSAFSDISMELFETSTMKTDWGEREFFKEQVLSYSGIREELNRLLDHSYYERG